jgi:hypothetical protein
VPAPAVIPAPRAYINAVAVKGFVVELGMSRSRFRPAHRAGDLRSCLPRTLIQTSRDCSPHTRSMYARAPAVLL